MRDRFLTAIFAGIVVLVLVSLVLFFARRQQVTYGDDSTPAGALQNYLIALSQRDYARAYAYVAETEGKPSLFDYQQSFMSYQADAIANTMIEVGKTTISPGEQSAGVEVTLISSSRGLFSDTTRDHQMVKLVRENGAWKISDAPYPYWSYFTKDKPFDTSTPLPAASLTPTP